MDRRKNEAIERTFDDVANHFSQVFELLVPAGKGGLYMQSDVSMCSLFVIIVVKTNGYLGSRHGN